MVGHEQPAVADQPREAPHRVGAAAEAEQEDPIAIGVVLNEKSVAVADVAIDALAEGAAEDMLQPEMGADALVIVHDLRGPVRGDRPDRPRQLAHERNPGAGNAAQMRIVGAAKQTGSGVVQCIK